MKFKDKLKTRLILSIAYMVIGAGLIAVFNLVKNGNEYLSTLGLMFFVIGLTRFVQYLRITKNEQSVKQQEILETDERNVAIVYKAKSMAFNVVVILLSIAIILLQFLNLAVYVQMLFGVLCALLVIYWASYFIICARS